MINITMEKFVLFCILLTVSINELVSSNSKKSSGKKKSLKKRKISEKIADIDHRIGSKNISYIVNPKKFMNYVEQFDKIKNLGEEVRCKLRGTCAEDLKRYKISRKGKQRKAQKKSMQSYSSMDLPDNSNQVIQPDRLISSVGPSANAFSGALYSNQPNAAEFGQQPQMNLKIPKIPESSPMVPQGIPSLDQMQNAANDASIQNSIQSKMRFMDSANEQMMPLPMPGGGPGGINSGSPDGMGMDGMKSTDGGGHPAFARHHGHRENEGMDNDNHDFPSSESSPMNEGGKQEERIRINGGPRGVPNTESSTVSDEDIYKAEGVQPNEMKDLHNFLSHGHKYKAKDEEEESERENAEFNESERRHGANIQSDDNDSRNEKEYRGGNRSPEKDERGEEHGRHSHEQDESEGEYEDKHHGSHHHGSEPEPGQGGPVEPMGAAGEMGPGVGMEQGVAMGPGGDMGPGGGMGPSGGIGPGGAMGMGGPMGPGLKPGGVEVPTLQNLMGGGMPGLPGLADQGMGGPPVRPDLDMDNQGRFVSDNQRSMMESNSDYDVPKTAFASLWKDYMLTTQSQLADKDPSSNNRELIHHPHHSRKSKVRHSGKEIHRWKKSNVEYNERPVKRSEGSSSTSNTSNATESVAKANVTSPVTPSNDTSQIHVNATVGNATNVTNSTSNNNNDNTSNVSSQSSLNNTSDAKTDTKSAKKSEVKYKPNKLPPIYLTEKNGEKLLVVHPTAEFIKSLPRINFTDTDDVKRNEISNVHTIISPLHAQERDDEDEEEEEPDDEEDRSEDEKSNIVARSNIFSTSQKKYVSVPVISPDPNGKIGHWLNSVRDKVFSDSAASTRSFEANQNFANQMGNQMPSDYYQNALHPFEQSRKSFYKQPDVAPPIPKEIQSLYQQYAPGDGKTNFQYAPSQDEVREELNFVERNKNDNSNGREENSVGQIVQSSASDTQLTPENDFNSRVTESDSAPVNSNRDSQWDREGDTPRVPDGSKRSGLPLILTKDHVGFGPIVVEAKTADAPPDDAALDE